MRLKNRKNKIVTEDSLQTNRRTEDSHEDAGMTYLQNKNYEEAIDEFRIALEEGNDIASINSNLGFALMQLGLYNESVHYFAKALGKHKLDYMVRYYIGLAYLKAGEFTPAASYFSSATRIFKQFSEAYYLKGVALYFKGKLSSSIRAFNKSIIAIMTITLIAILDIVFTFD